MEVVTQNPTVFNFLLGFSQKDWAECVMLTTLLGIKSLHGSRPTISQLRQLLHKPRTSSQTARAKPRQTPRVMPRHLRKVESKISTQARKDRELFRSLSKEQVKTEAPRRPPKPKVRRLNFRQKPVPQVLDTPKDESFEALLNALTPSKSMGPQKRVSASAVVKLLGESVYSSEGSI